MLRLTVEDERLRGLPQWQPTGSEGPTLGRKKQQPRSMAKRRPTTRGSSRISHFSQSLLREWKRLDLPRTDGSVVVAVSGGADSVAMLLALDELIGSARLNLKILVAHLNHRLRGKASDADARWVASLAKHLGHAVANASIDVKKRAAKTGDNLEQAARRARYEFLARKARTGRAKVVLTAHTMDDQAETVLLNLLRGSGAQGLAGVEPVRPISADSDVLLARPLLSWARRRETENYCRQRGVEFRSDEMNVDEKFARVRVRRQLLPLMETFNPKLVEGLARTAELLREDSIALDRAAATLLELSIEQDKASRKGERARTLLRVDLLAVAPPALRRRALRLWIGRSRGDLKRLERVHIVAVENLLMGDRGGRVAELPGGDWVSRKRGLLQYSCSEPSFSDRSEPKRKSGRNNPKPRR
jgi:tRNA(Ile)-lysidine synthase